MLRRRQLEGGVTMMREEAVGYLRPYATAEFSSRIRRVFIPTELYLV